MPVDARLAARLRATIAHRPGFSEKAMFGGVGYMLGGNMALGVMKDGRVIVRVAPSDHERFRGEAGCAGMERGGKEMVGWLLVDADAVGDDADLARWAERGASYAASLPPK